MNLAASIWRTVFLRLPRIPEKFPKNLLSWTARESGVRGSRSSNEVLPVFRAGRLPRRVFCRSARPSPVFIETGLDLLKKYETSMAALSILLSPRFTSSVFRPLPLLGWSERDSTRAGFSLSPARNNQPSS